MSLDFVVLDHNEAPEKTVSLSVDLHQGLMVLASAHGLTRIQSFKDYYEDVEKTVNDLPVVLEEIKKMRGLVSSADQLRFLDDLYGLILFAIYSRKSLHAIAD